MWKGLQRHFKTLILLNWQRNQRDSLLFCSRLGIRSACLEGNEEYAREGLHEGTGNTHGALP